MRFFFDVVVAGPGRGRAIRRRGALHACPAHHPGRDEFRDCYGAAKRRKRPENSVGKQEERNDSQARCASLVFFLFTQPSLLSSSSSSLPSSLHSSISRLRRGSTASPRPRGASPTTTAPVLTPGRLLRRAGAAEKAPPPSRAAALSGEGGGGDPPRRGRLLWRSRYASARMQGGAPAPAQAGAHAACAAPGAPWCTSTRPQWLLTSRACAPA